MMNYKAILMLVLVTTLLLGCTGDVPLNPQAKSWLADNTETPSTTDNAYIYAMGAGAEEGTDPFEYGAELIEYYKSLGETFDEPSPGDSNYFAESRIEQPDSGLICDKRSIDCIEIILDNSESIKDVFTNNLIFLNRYKTFKKISSFKTLTKASIYEQIPQYSALGIGHKLLHLEAIYYGLNNNNSQSINLLADDIEDLRRLLSISDNLILKMVLTAFLSNDLELISQLYAKDIFSENTTLSDLSFLNDLSKDERSLLVPMQREFSMMVNTMHHLEENHSDFFEKEGNAPEWLVKLLFKRNKTINAMFPSYKSLAYNSELNTSELQSVLGNNMDVLSNRDLDATNFIGQQLAFAFDGAAFNNYLARLHDLNCKFRLIKAKIINSKDFEIYALSIKKNSEFSNPYTGAPPYKDEENNQICFSGPLEDEKNIRCTAI